MNFFKVGIVDFFGILCPGVLLLMNLILLLVACHVDFIKSIDLNLLEKLDVGLFIFLFVICYLFGFILRLVSPDIVDKISTIFAHLIFPCKYLLKRKLKKDFKDANKDVNWKRGEFREKFKQFLFSYYEDKISKGENLPQFFWLDEQYPYHYSLKYIITKYFPPSVKDGLILEKYHNRQYINYWKTLVVRKDPNLATLVFQSEALVRFISGAFWALGIGIIAGFLLILSSLKSGGNINFGLFFTILSTLMSITILLRFKNQRRREVFTLLISIKAISEEENKIVSDNNFSE